MLAKAREFAPRQTDPHGVITNVGLRVTGYVRRNMGNDTAEFRGGSLIKGRKTNQGILIFMYLIDFVCREPRVDLQFVRSWNYDHHDFRGCNDASDGVERGVRRVIRT